VSTEIPGTHGNALEQLKNADMGYTDREVRVQTPMIWIVQDTNSREVVCVAPDAETAAWWLETYGDKLKHYESYARQLTIRGIPGTITVRRMEFPRGGSPRVI